MISRSPAHQLSAPNAVGKVELPAGMKLLMIVQRFASSAAKSLLRLQVRPPSALGLSAWDLGVTRPPRASCAARTIFPAPWGYPLAQRRAAQSGQGSAIQGAGPARRRTRTPALVLGPLPWFHSSSAKSAPRMLTCFPCGA